MNAIIKQPATLPDNPTELIFSDYHFERLERLAEIMASGKSTIPNHLKGSKGDCFAILMQAARWGTDPYAVAQKTHLVNGNIGYEAQLVIAIINRNAPIVGRLDYEWFGPWGSVTNGKTDKSEAGVTVFATIRGESEPRKLSVTMKQAGVRNSPLWGDDPKQQLAYLAAKRWARLHCPDVIMGVYTPDELEEMPQEPREIQGEVIERQPLSRTQSVKDKARKAIESQPIGPSLISILASIQQAETVEALDLASVDAAKLEGEEKAEARDAYRARKMELAQSRTGAVDPDIGEVLPSSEGQEITQASD